MLSTWQPIWNWCRRAASDIHPFIFIAFLLHPDQSCDVYDFLRITIPILEQFLAIYMESESELESKKESFFDSQCLISGSGRKNCNSWFPIFKRLQKKRPYRISFPFSGMWRHVQRKLDVLHDSDGDAVHHHHLQVPIRHLLPPAQLRHLRREWYIRNITCLIGRASVNLQWA